MKNRRDHKAEYARRIARGLAQGLSRSQARGHPKPKERSLSEKSAPPKKVYEPRLEQGLKLMRDGANLAQSARSIGVSHERLRRYLSQTGVVQRKGQRWVFRKDKRLRQLLIYSNGQGVTITVAGYDRAAKIGGYMGAVGQFLTSNNPLHLKPFVGEIVQDVAGKKYALETRPNVLYRLAETGTQTFEQVYRIVI